MPAGAPWREALPSAAGRADALAAVLVARVLGGRARPDLERWPDEDAAARHEVTPRDTAPMTKYISLLF